MGNVQVQPSTHAITGVWRGNNDYRDRERCTGLRATKCIEALVNDAMTGIVQPLSRRAFRAALVAGLAVCSVVPGAHAACLSGHHGLADEFAQTTVVVAEVRSVREVQDDREDPASISATLYAIAVIEHLRGTPLLRSLELRSDNTSSRFPMTQGRRYLLFVRQAPDGPLYIDACGHSGELPQARDALAQARKLSSRRR